MGVGELSHSEVSEIKPVLQPIKEVLCSVKTCGMPGSVPRRHASSLGRQSLLREHWRRSWQEPNPILLVGMVSPVLWAIPKKHLRKCQPAQSKTFRAALTVWMVSRPGFEITPSLLFSSTERGWEFKSSLPFAEKVSTKVFSCYPCIPAAGGATSLLSVPWQGLSFNYFCLLN